MRYSRVVDQHIEREVLQFLRQRIDLGSPGHIHPRGPNSRVGAHQRGKAVGQAAAIGRDYLPAARGILPSEF
jgi:hypothetical protein